MKKLLSIVIAFASFYATAADDRWASWGEHFITEERWLKTLHASYQ
ncbi:MAG: hypothetical protein ACI82A_002358 [Candidatus Azotimanducaceae bacterium]|jgi:hypothetical protein